MVAELGLYCPRTDKKDVAKTMEFKCREVSQTPIYVITHSSLILHTTFSTHSVGLWSVWFLTSVVYV